MKRFHLAVLILAALPLTVNAGSNTEFPLITNGVFDHSTDGNNTFAIRIETTTDWTNSDIRIKLNSGEMNHFCTFCSAAFLREGGPSALFGPGYRSPEITNPYIGDSAVWSPIPATSDFTQYFPNGTNITNPYYDNRNENRIFWDVSWFNTNTGDIGTFDIGMITLSPDANGKLAYRTTTDGAVEDGGYGPAKNRFTIINGRIVIPEPGSLALISIGVVSLLGPRRRRK